MSSETAPGPDSGPDPGSDPGGDSDSGRTQVDLVASAVLAVPGVHDLHGGVIGEVATYLPGRRVAGIRLREPGSVTSSEVHVVLDWDSPVLPTADAVRARLEGLVPGPVHVVVEDITDPRLIHPDPQKDT